MIDHQTASLGFELLARFDQLFPLPVDRAQLLFLLAGHAHQRKRSAIALDKSIQSQAQRLGIQAVGLHPPILLIQLLRADHVAVDRKRAELSLQRKTKPARLIDRIHFCAALLLEPGRPVQKPFGKRCGGLGLLPPTCSTTT